MGLPSFGGLCSGAAVILLCEVCQSYSNFDLAYFFVLHQTVDTLVLPADWASDAHHAPQVCQNSAAA